MALLLVTLLAAPARAIAKSSAPQAKKITTSSTETIAKSNPTTPITIDPVTNSAIDQISGAIARFRSGHTSSGLSASNNLDVLNNLAASNSVDNSVDTIAPAQLLALETTNQHQIRDIQNHWAAPFIEGLVSRRLVSISGKEFHPNAA
jgi:ABC-type transport system substrate-binding protein